MHALVSAVICFLDAELFLEEAIASVRNQSYNHWELLLVDDGSSDRSSDIARTWASREPHRIFYHEHARHANLGLSASRNLGIREARGELIAFLDADDVWLPERLLRGVATMEAYRDAQMVYGRTVYWHSWNPQASCRDRIQPHWFEGDVTVTPPELLIRYLEYRAALPSMTSLLVRRSACLEVGGFENSFHLMHEDQVFLAKFCLRFPVHVSNECWDLYRQHLTSACGVADRKSQTAAARRRYETWLRQYLESQGHVNDPVWKALANRQNQRRSMFTRMRRAVWRWDSGAARAVARYYASVRPAYHESKRVRPHQNARPM